MKNLNNNMENKFKLTMQDWENGIWGNRELYFKNMEEAKRFARKHRGQYKIYNDEGHVVHSERTKYGETYA